MVAVYCDRSYSDGATPVERNGGSKTTSRPLQTERIMQNRGRQSPSDLSLVAGVPASQSKREQT
jgi:hypothetical protein